MVDSENVNMDNLVNVSRRCLQGVISMVKEGQSSPFTMVIMDECIFVSVTVKHI